MNIQTIALVAIACTVVFFSSCSTSKKSTKTVEKTIPVPEGIEFTKVKNYESFALINLPYSGKGFSKNNDADEIVPAVRYKGWHFLKWSTIRGAEGDLDAQFTALKKELLKWHFKDNSEIIFTKKTIGKYETALVKISTPIGSKGTAAKYAYGYLIAYDNKAALFMVDDFVIQIADFETYTQPLDQAMQYMIKTVEFK